MQLEMRLANATFEGDVLSQTSLMSIPGGWEKGMGGEEEKVIVYTDFSCQDQKIYVIFYSEKRAKMPNFLIWSYGNLIKYANLFVINMLNNWL